MVPKFWEKTELVPPLIFLSKNSRFATCPNVKTKKKKVIENFEKKEEAIPLATIGLAGHPDFGQEPPSWLVWGWLRPLGLVQGTKSGKKKIVLRFFAH
jgi:hypothetical protein